MKWASKFSVFAMGLAVATATHPAGAMPVLQIEGSTPVCVEAPVVAGLDSSFLGSLFNQIKTVQSIESGENVAMLQEAEAAEEMIASLIGLPINGLEGVALNEADLDAAIANLLGEEASFSDAVAELGNTDATDGVTGDTTALISSSGGGAFYGGSNACMGGKAIIAGGHANHYSNHSGGIVTPHIVFPAPAPGFNGEIISGATTPLPPGALAGMVLIGALGTAHKVRSTRKVLA